MIFFVKKKLGNKSEKKSRDKSNDFFLLQNSLDEKHFKELNSKNTEIYCWKFKIL